MARVSTESVLDRMDRRGRTTGEAGIEGAARDAISRERAGRLGQRDGGGRRRFPGKDIEKMVLDALDLGATTEDIEQIIRTGKPFKARATATRRRRRPQGVGESILTGPGGTVGGGGGDVSRTILGGAF